MKQIKTKGNFLFNEETGFLELMILSEFDTKEQFERFKRDALDSVSKSYRQRGERLPSGYSLLDKIKIEPGEYSTLELCIYDFQLMGWDSDRLDRLSFEQFLEHITFQVFYQSRFSSAGKIKREPSQVHDYAINATGLMEAIKKFRELAQTKGMN